jgi:4-hydroxy-tetrahydrodipicolinate synthase
MRRSADGAMTGFAWPEMLVQVYRCSPPARRRPRICSTSTCRSCVTNSNRDGLARKEVLFPPQRHQEPRQPHGSSLTTTDRGELDG